MLFVYHRKVYDSVSQQAMWLVLRKYGVSPALVEIIQSLHDGMKVEVIVDGSAIPGIEVQNGLHQGWSMAPTLFNLYFNLAIVQSWRQHCQQFGIDVLYKCSGKLVDERTRRQH